MRGGSIREPDEPFTTSTPLQLNTAFFFLLLLFLSSFLFFVSCISVCRQ